MAGGVWRSLEAFTPLAPATCLLLMLLVLLLPALVCSCPCCSCLPCHDSLSRCQVHLPSLAQHMARPHFETMCLTLAQTAFQPLSSLYLASAQLIL